MHELGPDGNVYTRLFFPEEPEYGHRHVVAMQLQKPEPILLHLEDNDLQTLPYSAV